MAKQSDANPPHDLEQRERELKRREQELRLRELEAELARHQSAPSGEPPLYETLKDTSTQNRQLKRKVVRILQFGACFVGAIALVRLASWLAGILMVAALAGLLYVLFFSKDSNG